MVEDNFEENLDSKNTKKSKNSANLEVNGPDFLLFLILILLLMGNTGNFNPYFQLFNDQATKLTQIINALSATADGLKGAFETPQRIKNDLNLQF